MTSLVTVMISRNLYSSGVAILFKHSILIIYRLSVIVATPLGDGTAATWAGTAENVRPAVANGNSLQLYPAGLFLRRMKRLVVTLHDLTSLSWRWPQARLIGAWSFVWNFFACHVQLTAAYIPSCLLHSTMIGSSIVFGRGTYIGAFLFCMFTVAVHLVNLSLLLSCSAVGFCNWNLKFV